MEILIKCIGYLASKFIARYNSPEELIDAFLKAEESFNNFRTENQLLASMPDKTSVIHSVYGQEIDITKNTIEKFNFIFRKITLSRFLHHKENYQEALNALNTWINSLTEDYNYRYYTPPAVAYSNPERHVERIDNFTQQIVKNKEAVKIKVQALKKDLEKKSVFF